MLRPEERRGQQLSEGMGRKKEGKEGRKGRRGRDGEGRGGGAERLKEGRRVRAAADPTEGKVGDKREGEEEGRGKGA